MLNKDKSLKICLICLLFEFSALNESSISKIDQNEGRTNQQNRIQKSL